MRSKALGTLVGLLILLSLYVGAYVALVESQPAILIVTFAGVNAVHGEAEYRVGGEISRTLFRPVNALDMRLRPDYWYFTEEELNSPEWMTP